MTRRPQQTFDEALAAALADIERQNLTRELREVDGPQSPHLQVNGQTLLNFSSNDYLGLANHPAVKAAAVRAVEQFGAGSGASRLICGSLRPHHELEERLAAFKGTEAALSFSSGCAAALGAVTSLVGKGDVVIVDKLVHASLVDAAKMSGAKLRVFKHNDLNDLERILKWAAKLRTTQPATRVLVVTESVFSMDGDLAPLLDMVELKERHGAWLMVDEAHATGLFGERCSGLVEEFGLTGRVEVQMATLGKALGAGGGAICGSRKLIDLLMNRARSFIFTTAPVPASAAAAAAAIDLLGTKEGQGIRDRLWALVEHLKTDLIASGRALPPVRSAIVPLVIGPEDEAMAWGAALRKRGVFIPAIRYPSVARGAARLRLTMTAAHSQTDIQSLAQALAAVRAERSARA
jgi:8-amino-7-oxononanoate synthase